MLTFFQGDSVDMLLSVFHDDIPFNITNDKIWFTIKTNFADTDAQAILQVTTVGSASGNISFLTPTQGLAVVSLTPVGTGNIPTDVSLHCDVQIRTPAGKIYTVFIDRVMVSPTVTAATDIP